MMGTNIMSAIGGMIPVVSQIWGSLKDAKESKKLRNKRKPAFYNGRLEKMNAAVAQSLAGSTGVPGQGRIQNQLDADASNALSTIETSQMSPSAIAASAMGLNKNKMDATNDLAIKGANFKQGAFQDMYQQNSILAGYERAKYDYDYIAPWMEAQQRAAMLERDARAQGQAAAEGWGQNDKQFANSMGPQGMMGGGGGSQKGGAINTELKQSAPWGGNAGGTSQYQPWGGRGSGGGSSIDSDAIMNHRIKTQDWLSDDIDIMASMYK